MSDNNLVKLDGKAIEKLIDVVSKGMGKVYEPRSIRKNADAKAYEIEKIAEANAKKIQIEGDAKMDLFERAKLRFGNEQVLKQGRLEDVIEKSLHYLPESVNEEIVDEDWRTRFFNKAQDVSSEEMQEIWAKILADEISEPGKVSIRTLDVLSNLSKKEAEVFGKACELVTTNDRIYTLGSDTNLLESYGLGLNNIISLQEVGLLVSRSDLARSFNLPEEEEISGIEVLNSIVLIRFKNKKTQLPQLLLTSVGKELCRSLRIKLNEKYLTNFESYIQKDGSNVIQILSKGN